MAQGQNQNPQSSNQENPADPEQERVRGTQLDQQKQQAPRNPDAQGRGQAQQDSRQSGMQERPQADSQDAQDRSGRSSS